MERPAMARELRVLDHQILGFHARDHFRKQRLVKLIEVSLRDRAIVPHSGVGKKNLGRAVAERHNNDHGLGFAVRDQIVQDHVGAADRRPGARVVA